ncbi:MAG TPA: SGNH/GDSL hydrolase family protein [Polyangiales bacterium]|nr:SGNH/GDSL hydrolase family protein [Polyangiales bacterium]
MTICLVTLLSHFGCQSDTPPGMVMVPNVTAGMSAPSGTAGAGGTPTVSTGKACEQITLDPAAKNKCNNAHDKCLETTNVMKVREISSKCATGMLLPPSQENCAKYVGTPDAPEAVKCFTDCAKAQSQAMLNDTLSDACWTCPDDVVVCGAKFCIFECINSPLSEACTACLCKQQPDLLGPGKPGNCLQDVFAQCTGYRPTAEAVGCPAPGTGAAGMTATGAAGMKAPTAGSGTAGSAAGAGGMSTAGTMSIAGMGGAGGTGGAGGAGGMAGGPAAGSGGTNPTETAKRPCIKSGNEVVFIGDSYSDYAVAHTALATLVGSRARMDGAMSGYRNLAVAGTTLAAASILGTIPPQWDSAKRTKPIHAVVMDGGGNDVLIANMQCLPAGSDKNAGCQQVVATSMKTAKSLLEDMKAGGVTDVIWFWYPHLPNGNGSDISDYTLPMLQDLAKSVSTDTFHVQMIDTVPLFEGHPEYFFTDGIHANDIGEGKIADAVWKMMKDNCIGQSSGCCTP